MEVNVLKAIALIESGRTTAEGYAPWPWTVNQGGEGFWFDTKAEAIAHVRAQQALGATNIDIGCFQINLRWHGAEFGSLSEMFDPKINAAYAARYLTRMYEAHGTWLKAVGSYHSKTSKFSNAYVARFLDALEVVDGTRHVRSGPVSGFFTTARAPLASGGSTTAASAIGSLVPSGGIQTATPLFR